MSSLHADVFLAHAIPVVPPSPLPDNIPSLWTPTTSTLIHSAHSAVLVDPLTTTAQAEELADWVAATIPDKTLEYIYITHGHGDHFFGLPTILSRFPSAIPIATEGVLKHAEEQTEPDTWKLWNTWFPGNQLTKPDLSSVRTLKGSSSDLTFNLEDHTLHAVPVGHSDTNATTVLWVPDLSLVVAGDAVYNGGFQYLAESTTPELREKWIRAVKQVEELNPKSVVTGHKRVGAIDGAWTLEWTRDYLESWGKSVAEVRKEGGGAVELFERVKKLFPDNTGEFILWISSLAEFPPAQK